ncbi:MAG TPA: carboxypeptidase regulatory-like domain-containing protein [Pyrinomonadaceae bacterium]|jgi:hypothetical protein|nr:carboxypeptidase regulatory-like domain-containing protein [Pyrinomonadaceae bacterium]
MSPPILAQRLLLFCLLTAASLLFAAKSHAQQSNAGSSDKTTGTITGRVINSTGEPLAGASVSAYQVGRSNGRPGMTTADNRGEFKIDGLAPGIYSVSASLPGYISLQNMFFTRDAITYYHPGDSLTITLIKGAVITGKVTGADGALVGIGVFATRVRDGEGKKLVAGQRYEKRTDDRGVFRFYGLAPGSYILWAAKPSFGTILPSAYDNDVPTYYPSATRDTAAEIGARDGDEITADIHYWAESGHAVSGRVAKISNGGGPYVNQPSISIFNIRNRAEIQSTGVDESANFAFSFYGLPDGEYELTAGQYLSSSGEQLKSAPQRVTIRGADVTGITLSLAQQAAIDGQLIIEIDPKLQCGKRKNSLPQETMVWARRYEPPPNAGETKTVDPVSLSATNYATFVIADAKGSFSFKNLPGGSYRIDPSGFPEGWYVRSISKGPNSAAANAAIAREDVSVRNGEHLTGLTVTISEGAAQLRGRVSAGENMPPRPVVYLLPAEANGAENVLRFYEVRAEADGTFKLNNVAPGNYWIVAQPFDESDAIMPPKSIRRDATVRAQVLHYAETMKKPVTLKPCEQVLDFNLPFSARTP